MKNGLKYLPREKDISKKYNTISWKDVQCKYVLQKNSTK